MTEFMTKIGKMYYELDDETDEVLLFDSNQNYINHDDMSCYCNENDEVVEEKIIEYYKDITPVGEITLTKLGEPVMFAESFEDLLITYNMYRKTVGDKPMNEEEFKNIIQYNQIGNVWFIIYFNEY